MKKLFLLTLIGSMFLASCSSEEPLSNAIDASTTKVPVTINVTSNNEFDQLRNTTPGDAGVKSIMYVVYDEKSGDYIKHKLFKDKDLSVIKDTLSAGTYRILMLGASYEMVTDYDPGIGSGDMFDFESFPGVNENFSKASFIRQTGGDDEFFSKDFVLNVSANTAPQSAVLERISAKVEIIPTDIAAVPADLDYISIYFRNLETQSYTFSSQNCINHGKTPPIPDISLHPIEYIHFSKIMTRDQLMKITKDNPITLLILPLSSPLLTNINLNVPITVSLVNKSTGTIYEQRFLKTEYTLESNKVLRLKGNLFTSGTSNGVSIDDEWDSEIVEENFD